MSSSLPDPGACPIHPVRPEGRIRFRPILLAFLAAFIAAVTLAYVLARTRVEPRAYPPRARGWAYEDHVLAPSALPRRVQAQGGTLVHHPAIDVPPVEVPARYRAAPQGFDGPLVIDERAAGQVWRACKPGAPRIPDAVPPLLAFAVAREVHASLWAWAESVDAQLPLAAAGGR